MTRPIADVSSEAHAKGSTTRAFDAVLFDLGNVLVGWDPVGAFVGLTAEEIEKFFVESQFFARNHEQDAGRPWSQLREQMSLTHPHYAHLVDLYVQNFDKTLTGPVQGSAELVEELVAGPVQVFGLTNWSAELFHHAIPAAPAIGALEGIVVSGEVGLAKPDPAIFELTVQRFGLDPARTVFVDDSPRNVEAARNFGLHAVLFTTSQALRTELVELGILPVR